MYEIFKLTSASPVDFAAEELQKYLRMMMPRCGAIPIRYDPHAVRGFRLGLLEDFGLTAPEAEDARLDDVIHLQADENGQIIAGSNPRSVLLAVYRFLKLNGCRWLFPGVDGESIPLREVQPQSYHKMADLRYRGQCNEGATAQRHYLDVIDYLPKLGMNVFMLEFDIPAFYYDLYYQHAANPHLAPEPVTHDTILQWKRQCECEIQKRGLQYHDMGHGWTVDPFGLHSDGWDVKEIVIPDDVKPFIAEVGGKREAFTGVLLNTNACLSNAEGRRRIVRAVADYAEKQNNVDFLHVWLADNRNNQCECENCRKKPTADWYVILLNEIDELLTQRGLDTHIAFCLYFDTSWPPIEERLHNPGRFSLLFGPHSRVYTENYDVDADESQLTPYQENRNHLHFPEGMAGCLAYLHAWQKVFPGDCFAYEYHFWRMQVWEPTYQYLAHCIYKDVHGLKKHDLKGIIEDQTPRSFLPSGLAMTVLGESLFDLSLSFEEIEEDYMSHAFGKNWQQVRDFLEALSDEETFSIVSNIRMDPVTHKSVCTDQRVVKNTARWIALCDAFRPVVDENQNLPVRAQQVLWRNLYFFLELVKFDARLFSARYRGEREEADRIGGEAMDYLGRHELEVDTVFDLGLWGRTLMGWIIRYPVYRRGTVYNKIL